MDWIEIDSRLWKRSDDMVAVALHFRAEDGWFACTIYGGSVDGYDTAQKAMRAADELIPTQDATFRNQS